jgi:hypothetical protein
MIESQKPSRWMLWLLLQMQLLGLQWYNAHDCRGVRKFKSRALKRHKNFNGMTKRFQALSGRFRHGVDQFATAFESICVICQYQIEDDMPLYDVLIEDIMDEN